jgi:hypothetical protein
MTDDRWLTCLDPQEMQYVLRGKVSNRKWMLFAVACCRRMPPFEARPESGDITAADQRTSIDGAERFADGGATRDEIIGRLFYDSDDDVLGPGDYAEPREYHEHAVRRACIALWELAREPPCRYPRICSFATDAAYSAASSLGFSVGGDEAFGESWSKAVEAEKKIQAHLLRDVVGNPFRPPPALALAVREWNENTPGRIAQTIYEEGAFDRLPILADALEDAGCGSADILAHCRGPGPHVRGCWVVDLILGKQ